MVSEGKLEEARAPEKNEHGVQSMGERPHIPQKTQTRLWVLAGGRCQYEGCNEQLWRDDLTLTKMNKAYIAHIRDVNPMTHRYDPTLSPAKAVDIDNLMLLCDKHHRLIDHEGETDHSVDRLYRMKQKHEARIELLTSLQEHKQSHILVYSASIGEQNAPIDWRKASQAMIPLWYPAEPRAIEIGLRNSAIEDHDDDYWVIERRNLRHNVNRLLTPRIMSGEIRHLSVFALAPQPLLMELGRLLSDIPAAEVYQLHREPPDWRWQETPDEFQFLVVEPEEVHSTVALNLSLSATIDDTRITSALSRTDCSIWRMTISTPNNDFLKSREQLQTFRRQFRILLDRIKARHGQHTLLHVFPAVPVSIAVDIGRVWMPKADLRLCVFDQNSKLGGFKKALEFSQD